jgi:hypothetical protein
MDDDRLAEIKARDAARDDTEFWSHASADIRWLVGEVERLRKALGEIDNLASGAVRFGRQVRKQAQATLGWDHDVG